MEICTPRKRAVLFAEPVLAGMHGPSKPKFAKLASDPFSHRRDGTSWLMSTKARMRLKGTIHLAQTPELSNGDSSCNFNGSPLETP